jgi:parallel beta-helix repeat protein
LIAGVGAPGAPLTTATPAGPASDPSLAAVSARPGPCAVPAPTNPAVVDVTSKGAGPGDSIDDTAAVQAAIDAVPRGGTVLIPDGVFMIKAERGVRPKSSMTLRMSSGAVLRAITSSSQNYNVIRIEGASDVIVTGGRIEGDLGRHHGTAGEWGHGLMVTSSTRVTVEGVTSADAWGDGFYVGGAGSGQITFCHDVAYHNRRQGLSATNVDGLLIRGSAFTRTTGTPIGAGTGIDLEPNAREHVKNVTVIGNKITNNHSAGLSIGMDDSFLPTGSTLSAIKITGNTLDNNGLEATPTQASVGLIVSNSTGVRVTGNTVTRSHGVGILVVDATGTLVQGNRVSGTTKAGPYQESGAGIHLEHDHDTIVTKNTVKGNAGLAISTYESDSRIYDNDTD